MISSVEVRSAPRARRSRMEVNPTAPTIPTSWEKEHMVQSVAKVPDNKYKVTNTIYNVITYDRNGKLDQSTNVRYLDYIV